MVTVIDRKYMDHPFVLLLIQLRIIEIITILRNVAVITVLVLLVGFSG